MVFYPFCHCPLIKGGGRICLTDKICYAWQMLFVNSPLQLFGWFLRKTYFLISSVSSIKFCSKDNMIWSLPVPLREFWILFILKLKSNIVYYSVTSLFYFMWHSSLWNLWKETCGKSQITWLGSFLKLHYVTKFLNMRFLTRWDEC